jgi:phospho-N-acetylmuramoyl-pentapeptide-transferase
MINLVRWFLAGTLLLGCVAPMAGVHVAHESPLTLQPPSSLAPRIVYQEITAQFGERVERFTVRLEIDRARLLVIGLSPFGTRLFSLLWDGNSVLVDTATGVALPDDPRYILADIQIALGEPPPRIPGLRLVEEAGVRRQYLRSELPVIEVRYAEGKVEFHHHERRYTWTARTLG